MGIGRGIVWLLARNTWVGRAVLGDSRSIQTRLRLGQIALIKAEKLRERPTWFKYSSSESHGRPQTDFYMGYVGEKDDRKKVHIAVDDRGRLLYVRDIDGTPLFNRSKGDIPPPGWQ